MEKKRFSGKKFIKGLIVGGVVAGSAALLLAPRPGKETRQKISDEINDTLDLLTTMKQSSEDIVSSAKDIQHMLSTLVPNVITDTEKSLERFEFKTKPRIADLKTQLAKIETEITQFTEDI